jgi:hypothetical protein
MAKKVFSLPLAVVSFIGGELYKYSERERESHSIAAYTDMNFT